MALQSARNLAVKIRVFYKTGLPGSAHRATPVLRSLTLPLCRSTNERFRSSWHDRPSARIPYPRRPAPDSTFPLVSSSSTAFGETPTQSRASVVLKRRLFHPRSPLFFPVVPAASGPYKSGRNVPSGSRYARHTIHGDLPCFFTGCITRFSTRSFTSSTDPASATCLLIGSLTRPLAPRPAAHPFATRSLLPSPPPRTASPAGTQPLAQSRKSTVQERTIVPARCGRSCRWPTRCRRNREPQSGRCHRQYRPSAGRSSLRP